MFVGAGIPAFIVGVMPSAWLRVLVMMAAMAAYALLAILFFDRAGFFVPFVGLVEQLNQYFGAMTDRVMAADGMINKFMRDSLMAVWGNLHTHGVVKDKSVLEAAGPVALRGRPFVLNIFIEVGPKVPIIVVNEPGSRASPPHRARSIATASAAVRAC